MIVDGRSMGPGMYTVPGESARFVGKIPDKPVDKSCAVLNGRRESQIPQWLGGPPATG